jgi:hypothetical protein
MLAMWLAGHLVAAAVGDDSVPPKPNLPMPHLVAISRPDDDWVPVDDPSGMPVPIPDVVAVVLRADVERRYREFTETWECGEGAPPLRDLCKGIYVVVGPCGLDAYAVNLDLSPCGSFAYFFVHDTITGCVTQRPVQNDTSWMLGGLDDDDSSLVRPPLAAFEDVDGDGRPELMIQRQAHAGSDEDAAIRRWFHVGRDASLVQILAVEDQPVDPFDADLRLVKTLVSLGPNRLLLHVDAERDGARESRVRLGEVVLATPGAPAPFRVLALRAATPEFERVDTERLLVTEHGGDADEFLAGRTFVR